MASQFIAFDFETTGLVPAYARVVEIGAVKFDDSGRVLDEFQELVNPGQPIPPDASEVNGITDDMLVNAKDIGDVLPAFIQFVGRRSPVLFAHNAPFDVKFLAFELARTGLTFPKCSIYDTIDLARSMGPLPNYKLGTVATALGIPSSGAHRALADSQMVAGVVTDWLSGIGTTTPRRELARNYPTFDLESVRIEPAEFPSHLARLADALAARIEIQIVYSAGSIPGTPRPVIPNAAFCYSGKSYLVCRCLLSNSLRTFRIDRIERIV